MNKFVFVGFILRLRGCGRLFDNFFLEPVLLVNGFKKSRAGPCLRPGGSMCCVHGQDTLSSSPPRSMNGYQLIVWEA